MTLNKRSVLITGAALLAIASSWALLRNGGVEVSVETVTRDTVSVSIGVEGRTRARERFIVAAPVHGQLARIGLEEGDPVEAGEIVARILPSLENPRTLATLRADVEVARAAHLEAAAAVAQAETRAEQAAREAERRTALAEAEAGSLSREAIEQAVTAANVAARALEAARAMLDASEARLAAARSRVLGAAGSSESVPALDVVAPVSGRVLRIPDRSERAVTPGTPLIELADVRGLELVFDVLSEDAVRIEPGHEILVSEWGGEEVLKGRVRTVTMAGYTKVSALGVEEQRVDVIGDLDMTPAALGADYRVGGSIIVWRGSDVLTVPTSAVFRGSDGWAVFVVENGNARLRPVTLGRRNPERAELLDGLEEGSLVIVFPPSDLTDGASVRTSG
jgi:HlyD family secretion protein